MKEPTFYGRVLLPMDVIEAARASTRWHWSVFCGIMTAISTRFARERSMTKMVRRISTSTSI